MAGASVRKSAEIGGCISQMTGMCEGGGDLLKDGPDADEPRVGCEAHGAVEMIQER